MAGRDLIAPAQHRHAAGGQADRTPGVALAAAGGLLGALAASSCCILPLALFSLGVSGAWIGNMTALAPYQPFFLSFTVAVLGFGFHQVYGRRTACAQGSACARALPNKLVRSGLWLATALAVAALAFPSVAALLLSAQLSFPMSAPPFLPD